MARQLFELITDHLDINEAEYFGIYILLKNDQRKWLRLDKEIKKQLKGNTFSFFDDISFSRTNSYGIYRHEK